MCLCLSLVPLGRNQSFLGINFSYRAKTSYEGIADATGVSLISILDLLFETSISHSSMDMQNG